MKLKTFEEYCNEKTSGSKVNKNINEKKDLNEAVINYVEFDSVEFAEDLVKLMQSSDKIFKEVKSDESGRTLIVIDENDAKYRIWIDSILD